MIMAKVRGRIEGKQQMERTCLSLCPSLLDVRNISSLVIEIEHFKMSCTENWKRQKNESGRVATHKSSLLKVIKSSLVVPFKNVFGDFTSANRERYNMAKTNTRFFTCQPFFQFHRREHLLHAQAEILQDRQLLDCRAAKKVDNCCLNNLQFLPQLWNFWDNEKESRNFKTPPTP